MPSHDQPGGGRNYLADEVQAQRRDLTDLVKATSGMQAVLREFLDDAREERKSASEYRSAIREQLTAQRMEQQQVTLQMTVVQGQVSKLDKTLCDIEIERQQRAGAFNLASVSVRFAWTALGIIGTAALALFAWIMNFGGRIPPTPGGH